VAAAISRISSGGHRCRSSTTLPRAQGKRENVAGGQAPVLRHGMRIRDRVGCTAGCHPSTHARVRGRSSERQGHAASHRVDAREARKKPGTTLTRDSGTGTGAGTGAGHRVDMHPDAPRQAHHPTGSSTQLVSSAPLDPNGYISASPSRLPVAPSRGNRTHQGTHAGGAPHCYPRTATWRSGRATDSIGDGHEIAPSCLGLRLGSPE
jgi:hypothetical protein